VWLAAYHRSCRLRSRRRREVVRDTSETEGGHGHRPREETRVRSSVPVRRVSLQKSAGSGLASNKLACSAPKRVAMRVNGGLARHGHRRESVEGRALRKSRWRVGLHARLKSGEGPAETQDDVRASSSGRHIAERRWGGRGTGAIKATGFYEGSLSVEDTSGRHEPSPFTRRWSRRPRRLPHVGERQSSVNEPKLQKESRRRSDDPTEEEEATEVSEARSSAGAVGR